VACCVWQEKLVADAGSQLNFDRKSTMWTKFVDNILLNRICLANKYYTSIPAYHRMIPCSGKNTVLYNLGFNPPLVGEE
jgi:hypothetical protein